MKVFYSDHFVLPLPEGHRFPMVKYSMLRERVARDRICGPGELLTPRAVTDQEILRAHTPDYLKRVASETLTEKEVRRIGFPWSERMVERSRRASGGTLGACLAERDRIVLEACRERKIPVAVTMAGGYANEVGDTVDVHFQSVRRAADLLKSTADKSKETHLT
jgi:acetoin utilization deacetylase AcuC-like enzyme